MERVNYKGNEILVVSDKLCKIVKNAKAVKFRCSLEELKKSLDYADFIRPDLERYIAENYKGR